MELEEGYTKLQSILKEMGSILVAFSGGVDSSLLLKAAYETLGAAAAGATAHSPTYAQDQLAGAQEFARRLGIRHYLVQSDPLSMPAFVQNDAQRCYHCKRELFEKLRKLADREGFLFIAEGTNLDDLQDYRPGLAAAREYDIKSPLVEAGLDKKSIRDLSRRLGLSTWDKPAESCLSSRFPYGTEIRLEHLNRVEQAEDFLKSKGFSQIRVRHHGSIARIELEPAELPRALTSPLREEITRTFKALGFQYITLDLEGYQRGSLNSEL